MPPFALRSLACLVAKNFLRNSLLKKLLADGDFYHINTARSPRIDKRRSIAADRALNRAVGARWMRIRLKCLP